MSSTHSEIGADESRPRAVVHGGPVAAPHRLALAAQVLIAAHTALQFATALAGGTRSKFFALTVPLSVPLFVATVVVFLCWFRRCRLNAEVFAPGTHKYSPGFAVGAWFVPVAMLWIPRRITLDIWRATSPADGTWLVNAWWTTWLGGDIVSALAARPGTHLTGLSPYGQALTVAATGLAILMIRRLTTRQDARIRADLAALPFTALK